MSLESLGKKYGTDKFDHGFLPFYEGFFGRIQLDVRSVLEIGIADGASARMWLEYFPNAEVYGLDNSRHGNQDRWPTDDPRFHPYLGDQANRYHLGVLAKAGPFDIVIDDGGHTMEQQQVSLGALFPYTARFYVVEDLHTSFIPEVRVFRGGRLIESYPTGTNGYRTWSLLWQLRDFNRYEEHLPVYPPGAHLAPDEFDYLHKHSAEDGVHIFDRDNDHKHMTAVIQKKGGS